jgi:hypothetical protein
MDETVLGAFIFGAIGLLSWHKATPNSRLTGIVALSIAVWVVLWPAWPFARAWAYPLALLWLATAGACFWWQNRKWASLVFFGQLLILAFALAFLL